MPLALQTLIETSSPLTERLTSLHVRLLESVPGVDRIGCALYDATTDVLRTFIHSTRSGQALSGYEYPLSASRTLSQLARTGDFRVLDEMADAVQGDSVHALWLHGQGYQASFTVPMYDNGALLGFLFFDSMQSAAFTPSVQRDLVLYASLISMAIVSELTAVRAVIESARMVRELTGMRDFETGMHLERMARYSRLIASHVASAWGRNDEFVESVYLFASLHDIGKIAIPDRILLKQGRLDDAEREIMQTHVAKGLEIVDRIIGHEGLRKLPDTDILRNIVGCHHELLDGTGYPQGLKGDDVPQEARIVAVADVFDALTTERPYKGEWTLAEAFAELQRLADSRKLDPDCVAALCANEGAVQAIRTRYRDASVHEQVVVPARAEATHTGAAT